ncbi:MAG: hypothetical protein K0R78_2278 [Pelosinus sp.]|jgi:hypothetical protein|nr:hypothetical protein [Pelosinus sp.]
MKVYGIIVDGETLYSKHSEVIVYEAFVLSGIQGIDYKRAFHDIKLIRKTFKTQGMIDGMQSLREQGKLEKYYGQNVQFHSFNSRVHNMMIGKNFKFRLNPDIEFCCIEMSECEVCKIPDFH